MFSKDEINKAIEVIREDIDYIKATCPDATVEIDNLEFAIVSLEGYRDIDAFWAMFSEEEMLFVEKHKSVLDKLKGLDVNALTPIEAINLLNEIKKEME